MSISTSSNYSLRQLIPSTPEKGGYEVEFIDKEKCSNTRYGLSLALVILSFGGALFSADVRNAVLNKEVIVKKTLPLNSLESHTRIDTLWKVNFKDSQLNKAKLLEQELAILKQQPGIDHNSILAKKLFAIFDKREANEFAKLLTEVKTREDLKSLKYYLLASYPDMSDQGKQTLLEDLHANSPLFKNAKTHKRLDQYITNFDSTPYSPFTNKVDLRVVNENEEYSLTGNPLAFEESKVPTNFEDRYMTNKEGKKNKGLFIRDPNEDNIARIVKGSPQTRRTHITLTDLAQKRNVSLSQLRYGIINKLTEMSRAHMPFESHREPAAILIGTELNDLLQNKNINSLDELKTALIQNIRTKNVVLEELDILTYKSFKRESLVLSSPEKLKLQKEFKKSLGSFLLSDLKYRLPQADKKPIDLTTGSALPNITTITKEDREYVIALKEDTEKLVPFSDEVEVKQLNQIIETQREYARVIDAYNELRNAKFEILKTANFFSDEYFNMKESFLEENRVVPADDTPNYLKGVVDNYNACVENYRLSLNKFNSLAPYVAEKPVFKWNNGILNEDGTTTESIHLTNLNPEEKLLERAEKTIDDFFADPEVIEALQRELSRR